MVQGIGDRAVNGPVFLSLTTAQRNSVRCRARSDSQNHPEYAGLLSVSEGDDVMKAIVADRRLATLYAVSFMNVLDDNDFMEALTTDEETRCMTKGNANA